MFIFIFIYNNYFYFLYNNFFHPIHDIALCYSNYFNSYYKARNNFIIYYGPGAVGTTNRVVVVISSGGAVGMTIVVVSGGAVGMIGVVSGGAVGMVGGSVGVP